MRKSHESGSVPQRWEYDGRGRVTYAGQSVNGGAWAIRSGYDSADRLTTTTYEPTNEVVTTAYDSAGRSVSLCTSLGGCYVTSASYSALDQPLTQVLANGLTTTWTYTTPLARVQSIVTAASGGGAVVNQSYGYDAVGNITSITDSWLNQTQTFTYDHRDRLLSGVTSGSSTGAYTHSYTYNTIGNLLSKTGTGTYTYPAAPQPRPHTPTTVGGSAYSYDNNGNLLSGSGRSYGWNADNKPSSITSGGVSETYQYDADGNRVGRTRAGITTTYAFGLWEQEGAITRKYYPLGGQVVAVRDSASGLSYLHRDQLGSASVATNASGVLTSWQRFDPWGKVRASANAMPTKRNFTGQYLDDTGLLFYNARYYDPGIGRFVSADWIVPGAPALTVHPFGSVAGGMWGASAGSAGGGGPANAQDLNRYSYALNNPVRNTDPTGHCVPWCVAAAIGAAVNIGFYVATNQDSWTWGGVATAGLSGAVAGALIVTPIPGAAALGGAVGGGIAGAVVEGAIATGVGMAGDALAAAAGAVVDQYLPQHLNGSGTAQSLPNSSSATSSGIAGTSDAVALSHVTDLKSTLSVPKGTDVGTTAGLMKAITPRSSADSIRRGADIRYNRFITGRNVAASVLASAVIGWTIDTVSQNGSK